jgi:transcriptional regulator with XRE-family HTH domain
MRQGKPPASPDFFRIIQHLERSTGISRSGIARAIGVSPSTICRLYTGERGTRSYQTGASLLWLAGYTLPDPTKPPDSTPERGDT